MIRHWFTPCLYVFRPSNGTYKSFPLLERLNIRRTYSYIALYLGRYWSGVVEGTIQIHSRRSSAFSQVWILFWIINYCPKMWNWVLSRGARPVQLLPWTLYEHKTATFPGSVTSCRWFWELINRYIPYIVIGVTRTERHYSTGTASRVIPRTQREHEITF